MIDDKKDLDQERDQNVIAGRNAVLEAIRSGREIDKLLISHGSSGGSIAPILEKCRTKKIPIREVSPSKLDFMCGGASHQGVVAVIAAHHYCELSEILDAASKANEPAFIILCDNIEDPHNLGAIIRTAEATGVHGIVIPKHRSASVNATVAKAASGALEYMNICRVTNIKAVIDELKDKGLWIYGADMDGQSWCASDYTGPTALVIGSEGNGIGRLVKDNCDVLVSLPMKGKINSLNASVAAGVLMYEVARQRAGLTAK